MTMPAPAETHGSLKFLVRLSLLLALVTGQILCAELPERFLYVSPAGKDSWSGRLAAPNPEGSDGPFASISRARDAIRALRAKAPVGPITVQLRGGSYCLDGAVTFGPEDSGTEHAPITYAAYPGETPELIGGRRLNGHRVASGGIITFDLPEAKGGAWNFRSLFVDGRREIRARYPNLHPADPARKGFLYASAAAGTLPLGVAVGGIHNPGDWLEYPIHVAASGDYTLWLHYGCLNAPYGHASMTGRCTVSLDHGAPRPLADLRDTGGWVPARWARVATLRLSQGEHRLRWQNQQGGGLTFDALALCDGVAWAPGRPATGPEHLLALSARSFNRSHARQLTVGTLSPGPKDVIWCGPGEFREAWLRAPEAELHIFPSGECRAYSEILSLVGYDPQERRLQLGGPEAGASLSPGDRYYIENVREELDSPGEWYLDAAAGRLDYLPREGFSARSEVVAPRTRRLIQVEGDSATGNPVRYLRFRGLTLRNTDWAQSGASAGFGVGEEGALSLRETEGCLVEACRFLNLGTYAVCIAGGERNGVKDCDMAHLGGGGVLILGSRANTVADNHIHHLGEAYQHVGGIVLVGAGASDNTLSHNAIHDSSRYGISLKDPGSRNVVEFNRIQNTNLETSDTGGIEVTQQDRAFRSGSSLRNNLVADTIGYSSLFGAPSYVSWGIYLDSFASGYEVTGNVVCRTWNGGFMVQGGRDNRIFNNLFVDGQTVQGTIANFQQNSRGLQVVGNIFAYSNPEAAALETGALGPEVLHIDRNLYFPPRGVLPTFGPGGSESLSRWRQQGRDAASVVGDPRFRQPGLDDYALRPGSPALALGFRALPLSQVGPRTQRCTCVIEPAARRFWGRAASREP